MTAIKPKFLLILACALVLGSKPAISVQPAENLRQNSVPQQGFNLVGGQNNEFVLNEFNGVWRLLYRNQDVSKRAKLEVDALAKHLVVNVKIASDANLPPLPTHFTLQNNLVGRYVCSGGASGCAEEIKNWKPVELR